MFQRKPFENEFTQSVSLLRVTNVLKLVFLELMKAEIVETTDELGEVTKAFEVKGIELVREGVIKALSDALEQRIAFIEKAFEKKPAEEVAKITKKEREEYLATRFEFELDPKENAVVKALIKDGSEFLYKEALGVRTYEIMLINRSTSGAVKFIKIYITKGKKGSSVLSVSTYVYDRDIITAFFNLKSRDMQKMNEKKGGNK
jgi:hypothetical protein